MSVWTGIMYYLWWNRSLRTNMLVYQEVVSQLVVQSLKWTSSGRAAGTQRPFT